METIKAFGKINLGLEIIRKRPDGYHDINSLFHTIDIYDELTFTLIDKGIRLQCNDPFLPSSQGNLVYDAASLFFTKTGISSGIEITLNKMIPVGAGLGGGSADAAATLKALNTMYDTGLSDKELQNLGRQIGADIPFFIRGGFARVSGIGEILEYSPVPLDLYILLVFPGFSMSTSWVYKNYVTPLTKSPNTVIKLWSTIREDMDGMRGWIHLFSTLINDLESVTLRRYPELRDIKALLMQNGAQLALMSGSGSSVFGVFMTEDSCHDARQQMQNHGYDVRVVRTI